MSSHTTNEPGWQVLRAQSTGTDTTLRRVEERVLARIAGPRSQLRSWAHRTPAVALCLCALCGLALGASTVLVLRHMQVSVTHIDGREHLRIDDPSGRPRAVLPVAPGQGAGLANELSNGAARLLTLDGSDAEERAAGGESPDGQEPREPRVFRVDSAGAGAGQMLQLPDGRRVQGVLREEQRP